MSEEGNQSRFGPPTVWRQRTWPEALRLGFFMVLFCLSMNPAVQWAFGREFDPIGVLYQSVFMGGGIALATKFFKMLPEDQS